MAVNTVDRTFLQG